MFTAKSLVDGLYAGSHPSPRHGPGIEFHDYRQYTPGDDPAAVDWKLYGRTDRYYLRRYQRHTDLRAHLVVDVSNSMGYPDPARQRASWTSSLAGDLRGRPRQSAQRPQLATKLGVARELAAAIAFLAVRQRDRVGLALAGNRLEQHMEPGSTWNHLMRICHVLEDAAPGKGQGDLPACLRQTHALAKRRGLVVLISDLLDEPAPLLDALSMLRHDRFEVIVFQVLTPEELDLTALGESRLKLREMEHIGEVTTHVPSVASRYGQLIEAHVAAMRNGCTGLGCDHMLMRTDRPVIEGLARYLNRRTARR